MIKETTSISKRPSIIYHDTLDNMKKYHFELMEFFMHAPELESVGDTRTDRIAKIRAKRKAILKELCDIQKWIEAHEKNLLTMREKSIL